jgi:hypothetical protein
MKIVDKLININKFGLKLFILSLIIRLLFVIFLGNTKNPDMYEYGFLARNMYHGYGYTMYWPYDTFTGMQTEHPSKTVKSAFMPPFNTCFIYLNLKIFGDNSLAYLIIMLFNSIISSFVPWLAYLITKTFSSELSARLTGISSLIYLPIAFSVITFSGSSFYHLFVLLIILFSIKTIKYKQIKYFIPASIFSGILILNRSEFLILAFLNIFIINYFAFKNQKLKCQIKPLIFGCLIIILIVAPWAIRNTIIFGKFIPVVSHPWHEVWRGNNRYSMGGEYGINGLDLWVKNQNYPDIVKKLDSIPYNQHHELACDSIFKNEVINYVKNNKLHVAILTLKRMIILWTIDIYSPRSMNVFYIFFNFITLIPILIGILYFYKYSKINKDYSIFIILISFLIYHTFIFGLSNLIARYQIYFYTMALPFTGIGWEYVYRKYILSK